ncbi:MAG TPA: dihydrolipoyllysine-residue acetyltransferase [Woeseiaceae bacterium]|nr:dihydrolipoyllysine-residue acetyltransferase [Woeseiaceae bacterium]
MAKSIDMKVPDLGDFSDVEVIEVLVKAGDRVKPEDGLITLETEKASMDVPATDGGVIEEMAVSVGDRVSTGDVIGRLGVEDAQAEAAGKGEREPAERESAGQPQAPNVQGAVAAGGGERGRQTLEVPDIGDFTDVEVIEVYVKPGDEVNVDDPLITLETEKAAMDVPSTAAGRIETVEVSVGDRVSEGSRIAVIEAEAAAPAGEKPAPAEPEQKPEPKAEPAAKPAPREPERAQPPAERRQLPAIDEAGFAKAHASPSVRKLARELGVDLVRVKGTGAKNRVLRDDVKAWVKAILTGEPRAAALPQVPRIDFRKYGEVELKPLTRIQKIAGPRLQASWVNLPHVTQHDLADITELEARRQELKGEAKERGITLTPLAFIMKAVVPTLREFPKANASLGDDGETLVMKKYFHLGFAVDTEQGLVVPVIRDADQKDVYELAEELGTLSQGARDGKLKAEQMQGASFTITSLGGIGGTAFTPIVNAPEVAILGVSRSRMQPVWDGAEFKPRLMLPLSLSYDHRVIDGAYAVRFTTFLAKALSDVDTLLEAVP